MKRLVSALCAVLVAASVIGCSPSPKPTVDEGPIQIGAVLELTGGLATYGEETKNGLDLALEKVNKGRKRPIKVKYSDNKSDATETANAVVQLVELDKAMAVVGAVASSSTLAGAKKAQELRTPMMTPGSTNVTVTGTGDYISRVCFVDDVQGPRMAQFAAEELKRKKGFVIVERTSAYSLGLKDSIIKKFKELGGEIVGESSFESGASDFSALISEVKQQAPDVIFIPAYYSEVGPMLKQAQGHWDGIDKVGGDGWDSPDLLSLGGGPVIGTYFTTHFAVDDSVPEIQEFVTVYEERFGKAPGSMSGLGYDAGLVIADAIDRVEGELTKEKLKDAINSTKGVKGVTGAITLDANRNPVKMLVVVEVTADGFKLKKKYDP